MVTHNLTNVPEYQVWARMKDRCSNPRNNMWKHYGGRGIRVCRRWQKFINFYSDMGTRPSSKHSIDRKNNNGNYSPSNCRWATPKQQAGNKEQAIKYKGENAIDASLRLGGNRNLVCIRVSRYKWPIAKAFTTKIGGHTKGNFEVTCPTCTVIFSSRGYPSHERYIHPLSELQSLKAKKE